MHSSTNSASTMVLLIMLFFIITDSIAFTVPCTSTKVQPFSIRQRPRPLFVVADAEDISKRRRNGDDDQHNNNNNTNFDDAWIQTSSGGFLPNFSRRVKQLAQNKKFNKYDSAPRMNDQHHFESSLQAAVESIRRETTSRSSSNVPKPSATSKVQQVMSLDEYKKVVVDEKDSIVVVRFYAAWCRACKAISTRYRQQLPAKFPNIKFVEVPLTKENAFLHEGLGVPSLPFAHIYHPDVGLVEERKINQNVFSEFVELLQTYTQGYCDIPGDSSE